METQTLCENKTFLVKKVCWTYFSLQNKYENYIKEIIFIMNFIYSNQGNMIHIIFCHLGFLKQATHHMDVTAILYTYYTKSKKAILVLI